MKEIEAQELLKKYLTGSCSEKEKAMLESWYIQQEGIDLPALSQEARDKQLQEIWNSLPIHKKQVKLWQRAGMAAAAAVVLVVFGVWLYNSSNRSGHTDSGLSSRISRDLNDIAPGKNTATLTLANGKTIHLSDAKTGVLIDASGLKYNDSSDVDMNGRHPEFISGSRIGKATMLTASTPRGGTYQFTLPDGTRVWLNADSKISFPSNFGKLKQRMVRLSGEAYFEVAKAYVTLSPSKGQAKRVRQPFIVESKGQQVEVLGTHFNINSYPYEEGVKTTLLEGAVQVTPLQYPNSKKVLKPGEQAIVGKQFLKIIPVDVDVATAWKNGKFLFKEEKLESILNKLAYWYDVEIVYPGKKPTMVMTGIIERNTRLSMVLNMIEVSGKVKFKIEGRKVFVMD